MRAPYKRGPKPLIVIVPGATGRLRVPSDKPDEGTATVTDA